MVLLTGCSGGAYELLFMVWFRRGYRALGLTWLSSVVLHDGGYLVLSGCPITDRSLHLDLATFEF